MTDVIKNKYDFLLLFDVENGNPNGDPDAGNMPRIDPETSNGLVTDVCIKRKIRNYVDAIKEGEEGFDIYIKEKTPLNVSDRLSCEKIVDDIKRADGQNKLVECLKKAKKKDPDLDIKIKNQICKDYYDVRTFGAVLTTFTKAALNCGQVRGPVQLGFAKSIDPVFPQEVTITRVAITTEKDAENKKTEMGNKYIIPYGLYKMEGHISANLARKNTGFSEEDLELFWDALLNMFELDRSAARGSMAVRELIIFKHESEFGNAPAHKLFEMVNIARRKDVTVPRSYKDYEITINKKSIPDGVTLIEKI